MRYENTRRISKARLLPHPAKETAPQAMRSGRCCSFRAGNRFVGFLAPTSPTFGAKPFRRIHVSRCDRVSLYALPAGKSPENEQTQCQLPQEVTLIVNNESRVISDEQTLSSLCSLVLECSLNPDLEILEEDWEILFSYPNRTSTTLRFTQDGFFTADGTGYSPDNPEEWYQQLRSLVF